MNEAQRIERARRADMAMEEFMGPAFEFARTAYMDRLAQIAAAEPWATDKIAKLAIATRILDEVKGQIVAVIHDGDVAKSEMIRAEQIEKIPHAKRKILGLSVPR